MFPRLHNPKKSGDSRSPTESSQPKSVSFELLVPPPQYRARLPMRVNLFPNDTTNSIIQTVKSFFGVYERQGVVFEDASQNTLIPAYENFVHDMVVYVRVTTEELDASGFPPNPLQSTSLYRARQDDASRMPPPVLNRLHHTPGGQDPILQPGRHRDPSPTGFRARSIADSHSVGSHGRFVDSIIEVNNDSDSDGNEASVTSSQLSKKDRIASAEISVDNIVEGGRRKRAKFESSVSPVCCLCGNLPCNLSNNPIFQELPLFVPPQVPPISFKNPQRFSQLFPEPSLHIHRGDATSPSQESSRQAQGYSSRSHAPAPYSPFSAFRTGGAILPTPESTLDSSVMSDEEVARELMRLGELSRISTIERALTSTDSGYGSYAKSRISQPLEDSSRFSALVRSLTSADSGSFEDDTASTYTDESDLNSTMKDSYVSEFARLVFESLGARGLDSGSIDKIHAGLEHFLRSFALRLGHSAKSIEMLNSMVFIHRYRR